MSISTAWASLAECDDDTFNDMIAYMYDYCITLYTNPSPGYSTCMGNLAGDGEVTAGSNADDWQAEYQTTQDPDDYAQMLCWQDVEGHMNYTKNYYLS
jgi:hypothetical protein